MPQMMPINWLLSFIFFIMIFILFNILNYYVFILKSNKNLNKNNFKLSIKNIHWKW